jgi:uncharacterized membrane protein
LKKLKSFFRNYWWRIILIVVIAISLILAGTAIFFYCTHFKNASLSDDPQNWGVFGDYFGGVLNTLFAIINVCVTIWLTVTVNKFTSRNTDKQIAAEKKIATIQLRHEALRELRTEFSKSSAIWQTDIFKPKYGLDCQASISNFSLNYSYLFDDETIAWCNDFIFQINGVLLAIRDNPDQVEQLFNRTLTGSWNLFSRIGRKVIQ